MEGVVVVTTVGNGSVNVVLLPPHHPFALADVFLRIVRISFLVQRSNLRVYYMKLGCNKGQFCVGFGGIRDGVDLTSPPKQIPNISMGRRQFKHTQN